MKKIALLFAVAACAATILPSCSKKVPDDDKKPYDEYAVDLGLSVKWASINVGATAEKDLGKYYGWGEVSDKADGVYYDWDSYEVFKGIDTDDASRDAALSTLYDDKLVLKKEHDVAHVQWGGSWRMPTMEEFDELLNKCTWVMEPSDIEQWTAKTPGGWRITSKINGKSIFLTAAGMRTNKDLEKDKADRPIIGLPIAMRMLTLSQMASAGSRTFPLRPSNTFALDAVCVRFALNKLRRHRLLRK